MIIEGIDGPFFVRACDIDSMEIRENTYRNNPGEFSLDIRTINQGSVLIPTNTREQAEALLRSLAEAARAGAI